MFPVVDKIREALGKMDGQRYSEAKDDLKAVSDELWKMAKDYDSKWVKDKFWWWWSWGAWNNKPVTDRAYSDTYVSLKAASHSFGNIPTIRLEFRNSHARGWHYTKSARG